MARGEGGGRPTRYSNAMAQRILEQVSDGKSMREICEPENMPHRATVFRWLRKYPKFRDQYARAKQDAADAILDDIYAIADDGLNDTYVDDQGNVRTDQDVIQRSKLRVEMRKWHLSKLLPKVYGDKLDVTSDNKPVRAISVFNMRPADKPKKDSNKK